MYVERNNEACSCNHCCSGKALSVTYSQCLCLCVSVSLVIQLALRLPLSVICGLPGSTSSHKRRDFRKKFIENEMRVLSLYTIYVLNISFSKKN